MHLLKIKVFSLQIVCCLIAFFGCSGLCYSQSVYVNTGNHEKIYIHYNKAKYSLGDTLWFKAYLFNGLTKSAISKNFYLELLNDQGKLLNRVVAPVLESSASGNMVIVADSAAANLYCRAYTANILNGDTSFIYSKVLKIVDLKGRGQSSISKVNIRFMPEGGDWVNGLPALMAFKATDANEMPVNVTGYIKTGEIIINRFSTIHDGMGTFTVIPQAGKVYTAVWNEPNGAEHTTVLPVQKPEGLTMLVTEAKAGKKYYISRSPNVAEADKHIFLEATINNTLVYKAKIDLSNQTSSNGIIPVKNFPSGIITITIFNNDRMPLAERLTFVNNNNYSFSIDTGFTIISKQNRALNKLKLAIKDSLRTNISVAITDADLELQTGQQDNIISHLLLTGDLRGRIVNPYYYFNNVNDTTKKNLDLVMLTHGWRKYNGDNPAVKKDSVFKEHNFLTINGKISHVSYLGKLTDSTVNIIVQSADSSSVLLPAIISRNGLFFREGLKFYGDAKLFFKFNDKRLMAATVQIEVDNGLVDNHDIPFFKPFAAGPDATNSEAEIKPEFNDRYRLKRGVKQLNEVTVQAKSESPLKKLDEAYTTGLFTGGITTNFSIGDDPKTLINITLFQYLQNKIAGLQISNPLSANPGVVWRDIPVKFFLNNNETTISDIRSIGMGELDYVKIYDPSMGGAFMAYGGVVAVYTKKGKGYNFDSRNRQTLALTGYTPSKEFYSPNYATFAKEPAADYRITLYWNPNIIMDKNNGIFNLQFYNNDITRHFKIVIEGVNSESKLLHIEKVL